MKLGLMLPLVLPCIWYGPLALAKTAGQCERYAKKIAVDDISDELDLPPEVCKADVQSLLSASGGAYAYQIDVVCGDANVASNHHPDQILVYQSDCKNASPDQR